MSLMLFSLKLTILAASPSMLKESMFQKHTLFRRVETGEGPAHIVNFNENSIRLILRQY